MKIDKWVQNDENTIKIKIWRKGSIINAIYLGCVPQIGLIAAEYARGVVGWDFTTDKIVKFKYTNAVIKYQYGNLTFAIITLVSCLVLIALFYARLFDVCVAGKAEVNVSFVLLVHDFYSTVIIA